MISYYIKRSPIFKQNQKFILSTFFNIIYINIQYILGVLIQRNRANKTVTLRQEEHTNYMITNFNMHNCNAICTPFEASIKYTKWYLDDLHPNEQQAMEHILYKQAIGSLQYLVTCM